MALTQKSFKILSPPLRLSVKKAFDFLGALGALVAKIDVLKVLQMNNINAPVRVGAVFGPILASQRQVLVMKQFGDWPWLGKPIP